MSTLLVMSSPLVSSGSSSFDALRDALRDDPAFTSELERALYININRVNPSDRGNRFITGGAVEWIIAAAAWHAGVLTLPAGHSQDGYDLMDLQDAARGLWSVKSQSSTSKSDFRMSNGLGGGGRGFSEPTVFLSPHLPGMVFADPKLHTSVKSAEKITNDAVILPFKVISAHASEQPGCVARFTMPSNEGRGTENPFLAYTKTILVREQFPLLSDMFYAAAPPQRSLSDEVERLVRMRNDESITPEQFNELLSALSHATP